METLTLVIETQLATRARQVAEQRHTTLDSLVTEFLSGLTSSDETSHREAANRLVATIEELLLQRTLQKADFRIALALRCLRRFWE